MTILTIEITEENWAAAKTHFDTIWEAYRETAALLGIASETTVLDLAFGPLLARYKAGERTAALYEAMCDVE